MAKPHDSGKQPEKAGFSPAYYAAAFAGLCLFFWFLGGRAAYRNDELQHIHTSFEASRGGLPYRDYFDNHVPAYQFLTGLEIRMLGIKPSPDFPVKIRRLSFPLLAALLLLLVLISRSVIFKDREQYLAAALLGGALLPFMAAQARPEPLWGTLFFLSLYLFSSGPPSVKRFLLLGLLNGLNVCVSLKTLAFPVLPELLSLPALFALYPAGLTAVSGAAFLGGLIVFPGLLLLYFGHAGALTDFFNFAVFYSLRAGSGGHGHSGPAAAAIVLVSGLAYFAVKRFKGRPGPGRTAFFIPVFFSLAVLALYPVREAQTMFPFLTLAYLLLAALAVRGVWKVFPAGWPRRFALLCLLSGVVYGRLASEKVFQANNAAYQAELGVLLKLQPGTGGTVMDAKGESLFWRRPFFYALETFAVEGIRAGAINDTVPQDTAREATPVVFLKYPWRFTPADLSFFSGNYLPVCGNPAVLAAGRVLSGTKFETKLPLSYRLLCPAGKAAAGILDGKKYNGESVSLNAGPHSFRAGPACRDALLIWSRAAETGALPCGYGETQ